jgi:hypothetical protein
LGQERVIAVNDQATPPKQALVPFGPEKDELVGDFYAMPLFIP